MQVIGTNALDETEMHRPLIERSNLSVPTMKRIATFVSAALLETLISENHLPDEITKGLLQSVRDLIKTGELKETIENKEAP